MAGAIFVAPVLPLDVAMIAEALQGADLLDKLVTRWTFTRREWARLHRWLPSNRLTRRPVSPVGPELLCRLARADLRELLPWPFSQASDPTDASFEIVDRKAARLLKRTNRAVIGREDACLRSFERARELGLPALYHLQTGFCEAVRTLILRDREEYPEAYQDQSFEIDFAPSRLARKRAELSAADHILCPSSFVRSTVAAAGFPEGRTTILPLGVDTRWAPRQNNPREKVFLYVGHVSARKGVHRLLKVWKKLAAHRTHTLRLIGDIHLPERFLADYRGLYEGLPRMPREKLAAEYGRASAFVFNAMADGFGHVFAEAMSCGTPVLCSRNSGAPDLVTDGVEGRLYDYGNDDQLAEVLTWALDHPAELAAMGERARDRAHRWGWPEFSDAFLSWFHSVAPRR